MMPVCRFPLGTMLDVYLYEELAWDFVHAYGLTYKSMQLSQFISGVPPYH